MKRQIILAAAILIAVGAIGLPLVTDHKPRYNQAPKDGGPFANLPPLPPANPRVVVSPTNAAAIAYLSNRLSQCWTITNGTSMTVTNLKALILSHCPPYVPPSNAVLNWTWPGPHGSIMVLASTNGPPTNLSMVVLTNLAADVTNLVVPLSTFPQRYFAVEGMNPTNGRIHASWTLDPTAAGYFLYWGTMSQQYVAKTNVGLTNAFVLGGLRGSTTYFIQVTAYNGASVESPIGSGEVSARTGPMVPANLTVTLK